MSYLKFKQVWEDDSIYCFEISASNGTFSGSQEIFMYLDEFLPFCQQLQQFPEKIDHEIVYEDNHSGYYFLIRAFIYNKLGHAMFEIKTDNRQIGHEHASSHFFIPCEASIINKLGRALCAWMKDMNQPLELTWDVSSEHFSQN